VSTSGLNLGNGAEVKTGGTYATGGTINDGGLFGDDSATIASRSSDTDSDTVPSDGWISTSGAGGRGGTPSLDGNLGSGGTSVTPDTGVADYGRDSSLVADPDATNRGTIGSGGSLGSGGTIGSADAMASGGATGSGGAPGSGGAQSDPEESVPITLDCPGAAPSGVSPDWCSCDPWGHITKGDATYYNNIWGLGAAAQCIWVSGSQWGTTARHPNTTGVKSYPNISSSPGKAIGALNSYTSSFDITVPSSGAWDATYYIRVKNNLSLIEIMLWVNYAQGKVLPISSTGKPAVSNVTTGGHMWDVYYGGSPGHDVISLVRTTNTTSGTVDIKAILNWLIANKGSFDCSWTLDQMQFGFEIISDSAAQRFTCNRFSVSER
jgi:hypothetical protein